MAKLTQFENIFTGKKEELSPWGIIQKIMGVVVILFSFAMGQKVAGWLQGKTSPYGDFTPDQPYENPQKQSTNPYGMDI